MSIFNQINLLHDSYLWKIMDSFNNIVIHTNLRPVVPVYSGFQAVRLRMILSVHLNQYFGCYNRAVSVRIVLTPFSPLLRFFDTGEKPPQPSSRMACLAKCPSNMKRPNDGGRTSFVIISLPFRLLSRLQTRTTSGDLLELRALL